MHQQWANIKPFRKQLLLRKYKYREVNFTKDVQELYERSDRMLLKDIINVRICHGYGWKDSKREISQISPSWGHECSAIQIKLLIEFYMEPDKLNLKSVWGDHGQNWESRTRWARGVSFPTVIYGI